MTVRKRRRASQRRARRRARTVVGVVGLLLALWLPAVGITEPVATTEARWVDSEYRGATFTSGTVGSPVRGNCTVPASGRSFSATFAPPVTGTLTPTGYEVRITFTALLGTPVTVVDWTSLGTQQGFTYTPPGALALGSYTFFVRARVGPWTGPEISGTASVLNVLGISLLTSCSWTP